MSDQTNVREGIRRLFRSHPQLDESNCRLKFALRNRRLIFEVRKAPGGVSVTFGRAFFSHPDAIARAYNAAIIMRRNLTSAVRDQQYVTEEER